MNGKKAKMIRKMALSQIVSWTQIETAYKPHERKGSYELVPTCYKKIYKHTKKFIKSMPNHMAAVSEEARRNQPKVGAIIRALHGQYIRDMMNKEQVHNHG